ncbi:hypothetical protein I5Q34_12960 [Streptomyces sp. AV19]|uniref:hypothetical protein n=1 Tax=Streptomyces sp. AV19 TaxID=2793068 RepID=UPI0018FEAAC2|nr:hypothetical protein [Streptomyces sp. AV19]MBH1935173.1 hypothetical protein [Streptomyces sp. AV19]MDG4531105.1 hypothetical protein [Streptomyces sp. AV19]
MTAAVSVAVVLGLTLGCGGGRTDHEADGKSASGSAGGRAPEEAAGPPKAEEDGPTARLRRAELEKTEVAGLVIEEAPPGTAGRGTPGSDLPECLPLANALGSEPDPKPLGSVVSTFAGAGEDDDLEGLLGTIRVAEYRPGGAAATLGRLRSAAAACTGGFRMRTGEGESQVFDAVETVAAPKLGDEAAAFRLSNAVEEAPSLITVVRTGDVLSMFFATSLGDPERVRIPGQLVAAQVRKVVAVQRGEAGSDEDEGEDVGTEEG